METAIDFVRRQFDRLFMSFWEIFARPEQQGSPTLEALFGPHTSRDSKGDPELSEGPDELPSLEQLLSVDDLSIEVKMRNRLLVQYLSRPSVIRQLLDRCFSRCGGQTYPVSPGYDPGPVDDAQLSNGQPVEMDALCFEMLSCDDPLVVEAIFANHLPHLVGFLGEGTWGPVQTTRFCRLLLNLLAHNLRGTADVLCECGFQAALAGHLDNASLCECLAKSSLVDVLSPRAVAEILEAVLRHWERHFHLQHLLTRCVRALVSQQTDLFPFERMAEIAFNGAESDHFASSQGLLREVCLRSLICFCDAHLPWPYMALSVHVVEKQVLVDDIANMPEPNNDDSESLGLIFLLLSVERQSFITHTLESEPFTAFHYLLLCLVLRFLPLLTSNRLVAIGDCSAPRQFIKSTVTSLVVPRLLVACPRNSRALDLVGKICEMAVATSLFSQDERMTLGARCVSEWSRVDSEDPTMHHSAWFHWHAVVRTLAPSLLHDAAAEEDRADLRRFQETAGREFRKRQRFSALAPLRQNRCGEDLPIALQDSWFYEDPDKYIRMTANDDLGGREGFPVGGGSDLMGREPLDDPQSPFHNLWWCSLEDMMSGDDLTPSSPEDNGEQVSDDDESVAADGQEL